MLDLILMRHSKAVTSSAAGDHARGLSPRGLTEAAEAGAALAELGAPDFALVSDARRTRETFDRLVEALGRRIAHRFEHALYGASPEAILDVVAGAPGEARRLLVVGHNPGIGDLARHLAASRRGELPEGLDTHFPTSAFAVIRLDHEGWASAGDGGRLEAFVAPRAWQDGR